MQKEVNKVKKKVNKRKRSKHYAKADSQAEQLKIGGPDSHAPPRVSSQTDRHTLLA